jgi:hypothetical protein
MDALMKTNEDVRREDRTGTKVHRALTRVACLLSMMSLPAEALTTRDIFF